MPRAPSTPPTSGFVPVAAAAVALATAPLLALSDRAFNIDEPLFVWLAEQIARAPFDFFGFDVNWYGTAQPMYAVTRNPPATGYAIALASLVAGASERALHIAFAVPAAFCALATCALARRLAGAPLLASALLVGAPVFWLCANTVMSDVPMLALWLGAIWAWLAGCERGDARGLAVAGACASAAVLTKYFAIALVPLLALHAVLARVPLRRALPVLAAPCLALAALELAMDALYGAGALAQAVDESLHVEGIARPGALRQLVEGLAFAGGCALPALALSPWLFGRAALAGAGAAVVAIAALAPASLGALGLPVAAPDAGASLAASSYALQLALMAAGGAAVLALAAGELRAWRSPESALLGAWALGTFAFAAFVNWTNNGRSNLPLAPVVALLVVRRLAARERRAGPGAARARGVAVAAAGCVALAFAIAAADRSWSNGVRDAARAIAARHGGASRPWFHGHWGFQLYLERAGGRAVDWRRDVVRAGEVLVVPTNNAEAHVPAPEAAELVAVETSSEGAWIRTQAKGAGASFNASNLGSLPFVIGPSAPDRYRVFRAREDIRYERWFDWSSRAAAAGARGDAR
ncbi:MAG: glycosyltransferase family 39 protein [Myxococcota bacterium]